MMHRAWSSIVEVPYCFSRSYIKLQGHMALKIVEFDPNWGVSGLQLQFEFTNGYEMLHKAWNSKERCPIVFQGHPSNFKVTRYKTSPILTQIGRFRTIGRSQLSNPSDLPCYHMPDICSTQCCENSITFIFSQSASICLTWQVICTCCCKSVCFTRQ